MTYICAQIISKYHYESEKYRTYSTLFPCIGRYSYIVGVLARQFVLSRGVDDFSSTVAKNATVIVLMAIYASLQTIFNQLLLPRIEAFLLRFSAFQTIKNYNDTVSVPEALTIEDSNQATPDVIESAPTAEETISEPSEYEVLQTNTIAEKNRAIQTKLEKVLNYTKRTCLYE